MKISCQSCHAKYNVADEKIQGKIVKIRCRKCGTTIVVNATAGAVANGPAAAAPAPAAAPPQEPAPAPVAGEKEGAATGTEVAEWHVSVAENDQRTMTLADLVTAYGTGLVAADSYVWTEGMDDWKPLGEVDAVVSALNAAATQPASGTGGSVEPNPSPAVAAAPSREHADPIRAHARPAPDATQPYARPAAERPAAYGGGGVVGQAADAQVAMQEPRRAAVVKREARARDLFATRTGEEERVSPSDTQRTGQTSIEDARLTGQRNENSVLFSLEHLTKSAEERSVQDEGTSRADDSGIIDLKALAAKAESMRPPAMADGSVLIPPLGFTSPLGAPLGGFGSLGSETQPKSKLPLLVGGGVGIALLLVLGIVIGLRIGGAGASGTTATTGAAAFALPSATATASTEPTASASITAPPAQASPSAASSVAATPGKPHGPPGAAWHGAAVGGKPAGGGVATSGAGATGGASTGTAGGGGGSPPPKKGDCGCNGDLMCMMKCSTR
jgi:predicted Zn finger-like uncharacterized protein